MDGLNWKIKAKSFFQTNTEQAKALHRTVVELSEASKDDIVYDLYTGVGTIAHYISRYAKNVFGVEFIESDVEDAKENAKLNNIENTYFYCGDVKDIVGGLIEKYGHPNIIIIDHPRAGIHQKVINAILEIKPKILIYVSCNPATQARDISLLKETYNVEIIQPVDMFPNTYHVENIIKLKSTT